MPISEPGLLTLLHLCDSLFPLGGFAHSDGLETATATGRITDAIDLRHWIEAALDQGLGRYEGPAVRMAWRMSNGLPQSGPELAALDAEVYALRPSSSSRQASRAMGVRLVRTWRQIYPSERADALPATLTLPVAFGAVCAAAAIGARASVDAFIYTRLAATMSCAMRLMPIGQQEAHRLLAEVLERVPGVVDGIVARDQPPGAFMPAIDYAAMSQQYLPSRLFRS